MNVAEMFEHATDYKFLIEIAFILLVASIGGELAKKVKMPSVLGQIIVGIIIGPSVLKVFNGQDEIIHYMSQIGVVFLMFLAGLETDLKELKASGRGATSIALGGVIFPLALGTIIPYIFFKQYIPEGDAHHQMMYAVYIGTILTATSVSISVSVLRDMKQLSSHQGISILGGAIIDDVVGIILLAIVSGLVHPSGQGAVSMLVVKMVVFFVLMIIVGFILSKAITRFAQGSMWRDRIVTVAVVICLAFSFAAEMFSIATITGAYFAGVIFATTPYRHRIAEKVQSYAYTLFTPIFFVSIGLSAVITSDIINYIGYALVIVLIAIVGKIVGCGIGAKLSHFSNRQSLQVGVGMIARAEVALIVANQGMKAGLISNETFTSVVLLVVISTIVTPPLLKLFFKGEPPVSMESVDCIDENS
jgi:Kef-type K+ transport system membrane component KefB